MDAARVAAPPRLSHANRCDACASLEPRQSEMKECVLGLNARARAESRVSAPLAVSNVDSAAQGGTDEFV
jgi:hypothetical protein